jgi:hypothetical protein
MSSSPPSKKKVSIPYILEHVIDHTKIAERILQFIDEIYQVLVHFYALDRYSNRERSTGWFGQYYALEP